MKTNNRIPCERSVEFRATENNGNNDGMTLEGYAAVFNTDTTIRSWEGEFTERMVKGAFRKTLRDRTPNMQWDHGKDTRVGTVPIGVYESLSEDDHGLKVVGRLFDNDTVLPVRQAIEAGAVTGMSFKFEVIRDEWRDNKGKLVRGDELYDLLYMPGDRGPLVRTIKEVKLYEAGPVANPAYPTTTVGVRTADQAPEEEKRALVEQYKRSMQKPDDDEPSVTEWLEAEKRYLTEEWLAAETRHNEAIEKWLAAEDEYRNSVNEWLAAETAIVKSRSDAAPKGTSRKQYPPRSAVRKDTQQRESSTPAKKKDKVMNLEELRALINEKIERQTEIQEEHRDAELPEDLNKEWDDNEAEIARAEAAVKRIEARQERIAALAKAPSHTDSRDSHRQERKVENIYDLDEIRKASYSGDDFVERARDAARKALENAHFPDTVQGKDVDTREGLDRMLSNRDSKDAELAKRILTTGSPVYERAFGKAAMAGNTNGLTFEEHRAMAVGTDAAGNFAVPFQLDPTIVHVATGYVSPIRQLAKKVQLVGKEYQTLSITEATVSRAAEGATATDGSPTLAQQTLRVNKVHGFIPFSMEVDEDWNQLRSEMATLLNEAKAKEEATSFMTGAGTTVPEGLLTGATTLVSAGSGLSISAADIYKLEEALPIEFRDRAVFLGSKTVYNKIRQLDTAGGAALWVRLDAATPNKLIGYDAYEASIGLPATTPYTNGQKLLVFGDFNYFTILDRVGMSIELIPMLFDATIAGVGRPTGQRGLYAHWRNTSKVTNANAFRTLTATT